MTTMPIPENINEEKNDKKRKTDNDINIKNHIITYKAPTGAYFVFQGCNNQRELFQSEQADRSQYRRKQLAEYQKS